MADDRFAEGFKCICSNGYTGNHCETFVFNDSGIPDCPTSFCKNGGVCYFPSSNTPACNCTIGFSGPFCQFQELTSALKGSPNVCQPSPCGKGSKCVDRGNGTFVCICSDGLTGEKCDQDIDECTNNPKICGGTQTCINTFGKYECVCEANFTGPNCSIRLTGCSDTVCPRNRYCQPFWNETIQQHTHQCLCNYGYQGESCELETTASFTGQSLLAFISSSQGTAYRLQLRFRTTLPHAYIASGDDILGTNVYRLELTDHQIRLTWGLSNPEPKVLTLGRNLSDSNWYGAEIVYSSMKIKLKLSNTEGRPIAMDQSDVQLESLAVFSTKFGGIASRRQSTTEDSANFVGCLQDVRVNDQWIIPSRQTHSSVNVLPGCNRSQQCRNDTCRTNGQCVDLWITHKCICERPFLPPNCDYSLKEATFGHEKSRNYVKIDMTSSEKQSVEMNVEISMLLRTTASQGQLMYIGSPASLNSDLETFIAVELTGGRIRSNVKLGQKVQLFTGGPIISNGNFHLFSIVRNENRFKAYLNKSLIIDQLIDHPFPHPLLAEIFYVGGIPDIPLPGNFSPKKSRFSRQSTNDQQTISPSAFSSSSSFKGLIQDLRLRDQLIPFFPLPDTVRSLVAPVNTFGRTSLVGGVLQGTVSDDTCTSGPCANDGICNITFNDFK